jgi:hypothetical protein
MPDPTDPDDAALAAALARSRLLVDAPDALIQRTIGIFEARRPTPRRLAAVLRFDSLGLAPQAAGVRSGGDGTRQLLFSAEGRDVDLRIAPDGDRWRISGQVLGPDAQGRARLESDSLQLEVDWNELSEFGFESVPPGTVVLTLHGEGWEMVLPALKIPDGA